MAKKNIFKVSHILDRKEEWNPKTKTNTVFYKVAWKGYSDEEATWEPTENLGKTLQKQMRQFDNLYQTTTRPIKKVNIHKEKIVQKKRKNPMKKEVTQVLEDQQDKQEAKIDLSLDSLQSKYLIKQKQNQQKIEPTFRASFQKNQKDRLSRISKVLTVSKNKPKQKISASISQQPSKQQMSHQSSEKIDKLPQIQIIDEKHKFSSKQTQAKPATNQKVISSDFKIKGMIKHKDSFLYLIQQNKKSRLIKRKDMLVLYPYELICFYQTRINIDAAQIDDFLQKIVQKTTKQEDEMI